MLGTKFSARMLQAAGVLLLIAIFPHTSGIEVFFTEVDYDLPEEGTDNSIILAKVNGNVENIEVLVSFFTFEEFANSGLSAPSDPLPTLPDPAERDEDGNRVDFNEASVPVTIPPSGNIELQVPVDILDDLINEAQEGYIARMEIVNISPADEGQLLPSRRDTTLIRINDNDILIVGFNTNALTVTEGDGPLTGLISVAIQNDGITEQSPEVTLSYTNGQGNPAINGIGFDFIISSPLPFPTTTLNFGSDTSIPIDISIEDDGIFEGIETFGASLSIPNNPIIGLQLGERTFNAEIIDNDEATIGFEQEVYRVSESAGSVTLTYMIFDPSNLDLFDSALFLTVDLDIIEDTAVETVHFDRDSFSSPNALVRFLPSADISFDITDDSIPNPDREFIVTLNRSSIVQTVNFNISPATALVIIEDDEVGLELTPAPSITANEGETATVTCGPTTLPDPIQLLVNGVVDTGLTFSEIDSSRVFTFGPVDRADDGTTFQCSSGDLLSDTTTLSVFFLPLYTGDSFFTEVEGEARTITLELNGNPFPEISTLEWTFNGEPIQSDGRITLGLDFISFSSVLRQDAGSYTVFSSNSVGGSNVFEFTLEVLFLPTYTGGSFFTEEEGQQRTITLGLTGNPFPEINTLEWTFNGQPIQSDSRITLELDSISFSSVLREDAGNYTVFSSNSVGGSNVFEFALDVLFPPMYSGLSRFTAIEGEVSTITLELTGNLFPEISTLEWTFNGQPIQSDGRITLGLDFISFSSVLREDAGNYTVFSSNSVGGSNVFELTFEVFFAPEYEVSNTFMVTEGERFLVRPTLTGNPLPTDDDTVWSVDGRVLALVPGIDFGSDFLEIDIVTRMDEGNYTVSASNLAGTGNATFQLLVEIPPVTSGPMATTDQPPATTDTLPATTDFPSATTDQPSTDTDPPFSTTDTPLATTDDTVTGDVGGVTTSSPGTGMGGDSMGMGGDPHFSILLPTNQLLCFSVQGEHNFTFNLISNSLMNINARFDRDRERAEVTWMGSLGVVVKTRRKISKIRFDALAKMIYIDNKASLMAEKTSKLTIAGGKLSMTENTQAVRSKVPEVDVEVVDAGISFSVRFMKSHIDMVWHKVGAKMEESHGIIGQFFRKGVEVDETRRLLQLPSMEPVPVMRKPVWHFMERDTPDEQLCWVAMNPGYQGERLLQGHYLDYLVDDVLSSKFVFKPGRYNRLKNFLRKK